MKTKLLTILSLLVLCVTGAWADDPTLPSGATPTGALNVLTGDANVTAAYTGTSNGKKYLTYDLGTEIRTNVVKNGKANWAKATATDGGSSVSSITFADDVTDAEKYGFKTSSLNKWGINSSRYCGIRVVNCVEAAVSTKSNSNKDNKTLQIQVYKKNGDAWNYVETIGADKYNKDNAYVLTTSALDASEEYVILLTSGSTSNSEAYEIRLAANATPSLTGAWILSEEDVTGKTANIVQGAAAPSMPTFTVGATSGTPTASNYNVSYSFKSGYTSGIFQESEGNPVVTAGVPQLATTPVSGSATIVATLTTTDASAFLTPATNTFEYTVTVSAASAPSAISISGDASAARGADAITLTADVTGGVPDPNIEWFACDDDQKSNAVSQGAASTSNTTFDVATTTVGTYYYYAVATNATGSVASAVKTITIVPQAPTLTAGGYFSGDSKSVEIAKATGEDAAAVIKYSTDNGESWSDYSEALSLTATTTVKAKVVQSGLESVEVSATYTKFTSSTITEVNAITTWDWTGWNQTLELKNDGTTNPSSTDDYTFDDIAAINGGITVPASFNGAAMKFKGEYPVRSKKSQAGYWTIKPSVNGTITVTFSDTGSSIQSGYTTETQPKRYLNINGTNTDYYTKRTGNSTDKKAVTVPVSAGEVVITGMGEDGETWQAIVVEKIIFTPTATVTTNKGGWTSFTPSWNATLEDGATAYIITSIDGANNSVEATAVSVMESGKGYFIKGDNAETEYTVTATSTAATPTEGNLIVGNTSATTISATSPTTTDKYVLGTATAGTYSGQSGLFKVDSSVNVAAGKAYLDTQTTVSAQYLSIAWDDDMTTTIDNFTISQFDKNATRYNLAGQKVSDSYKGIVIVNGKKYLCK